MLSAGTRRRPALLAGTVGAAAAVWWLSDRRRRRRAARRLRYLEGRAEGWRYRLLGGHPAEQVTDEVLTQRVRSGLGQTTRRLDLPHVHVAVTHRVVLLHGEVGTEEEADVIEQAARRVAGVDGVLSYLHVGLGPGQTRPSEGTHGRSPALQRLLDAAESAGTPERAAGAAVRAVLATFLERLPAPTRAHLLAHLPADVQALTAPPRRHGSVTRMRRLDDFLEAVLDTDRVAATHVDEIAAAVLSALHDLVPEQAAHVAAVLPRELRRLWPQPTSA